MRIQPLHAPQPQPGKVVDGTENTTKDTSYELIRTVDDWLVLGFISRGLQIPNKET
jgi:hypothetical protein